MASAAGGSFQVDRIPRVDEQLRELGRRAKAAGIRPQLIEALNEVTQRLATAPQDWGDPEYNTKLPGGVVYHGIYPPLILQYVVYEAQRWVCIVNVKALPGSPLDQT